MTPERAAVRAANLAFYRAFEALDLAAMERLWAQDDSVSCLHPGWPLCAGWAEVRASWATIFANTGSMRFELAGERIDVREGLAWVVCVERIRSTGPGGDAMVGAVIATNVFRSDGGAWKLVHHHGSPHVARRAEPRGDLN
ncbi:MAG TPA: nuclear transport factor 2 family protein [Polyangia bacterium]